MDSGIAAAIDLGLRIGLLAVFVPSLASKLRAPNTFRVAVREYALVPTAAESVAVAVVIGGETIVVASLVFASSSVAGAAAALLLAPLTAIASVVVARGGAPPCGCGGLVASDHISWATVGRNIVLIIGSAALAAGEASTASVSHALEATLSAVAVAVGLLFGAIATEALLELHLVAQAAERDRQVVQRPLGSSSVRLTDG